MIIIYWVVCLLDIFIGKGKNVVSLPAACMQPMVLSPVCYQPVTKAIQP